MKSPCGEASESSQSTKVQPKYSLICLFYKCIADPGEEEMDWRLSKMESIQAFPGTVGTEPASTCIHMLPYKHCNDKWEFHWDPFQQPLGTHHSISQALKSDQKTASYHLRNQDLVYGVKILRDRLREDFQKSGDPAQGRACRITLIL